MKLLFALALVTSALGQDVQQLLVEGIALREQGRDTDALNKFRDAYALSGSPRALAQIALAEQALGRWLQARKHLDKALSATKNPWITRYRGALLSGMNTIRSRLGQLEVVSSVEGAKLVINGKPVGRTPLSEPIWVVAGTVVIRAEADGYWPIVRQIEVPSKAQALESLRFVRRTRPRDAVSRQDVEPPTSTVKTSPSSVSLDPQLESITAKRTSLMPYFWTSAAIAAVGAGVGTAFLVVRNDQAARYNDDARCGVGPGTREENCPEIRDSIRTSEMAIGIGFVASGVAASAAIILALIESSSKPSVAKVELGHSTFARCGQGPGLVGISCGVSF
ncbi:MAG: PEGA domain-containing protein [Myxococcales bacterium]|nr:PEGA domain-containing protein [Myxococcales bacterium]